jgi:hypothetical protein
MRNSFLYVLLASTLVGGALGAGLAIDARNFDHEVANSHEVWFLEFYSPR